MAIGGWKLAGTIVWVRGVETGEMCIWVGGGYEGSWAYREGGHRDCNAIGLWRAV